MLPAEDQLYYACVIRADMNCMEKKGSVGGALGFDVIEE